jgi:hypothetical protein
MHKWIVAGVLVVCFVLYWIPAGGSLFMYGMGEPGRIRGFGLLPVMWSVGEWLGTIWVFSRPRRGSEPPAGDRWLAAAMIIVGSSIGGVLALFIAPSLQSNEDLGFWIAGSIVIASHWLGRWYLRRAASSH